MRLITSDATRHQETTKPQDKSCGSREADEGLNALRHKVASFPAEPSAPSSEISIHTAVSRRRVFFYVDGFNLYHRRLEPAPELKWLCLRTLARSFLFPRDEIALIKFFTAKVDPGSISSPKRRRQEAYWDALRSTQVEVIEGLLEPRERKCRATVCGKEATFRQMSEKMTDVNLALHIYRDFLEQKPDVICVLSGDSDVIPALRMVRESNLRKVMIVVLLPIPDNGLLFSRLPVHYQVARTAKLGESALRLSQLPDRLEISPGNWSTRPDTWR